MISNHINQISFKGNFSSIGKTPFNNFSSKLGKTARRVAEETLDSSRVFFRRLKKQNDLPFTEKPITLNMQTNESMKKELDEAARKRLVVKWRKEDNEKKIKANGHNVDSGDLDQSGYPTTSGQKKIDTKLHHHDDTAFRGHANGPEHMQANDYIINGDGTIDFEHVRYT